MRDKAKIVVISGLILITYTFILYNFDSITSGMSALGRLLTPFIWGFVISYLINPLINFVSKLWKKLFKKECKYWVAMIIGYVVTIAVFSFIIASVIPQLITSMGGIISAIPDSINKGIEWLKEDGQRYINELTNGNLKVDNITEFIGTSIKPLVESVTNNISKAASATFSVVKFFTNFILGIIISIYMMMHRDRYIAQMKKLLIAFTPEGKSEKILNFLGKVNETFSKFINAKIIDSVIIGAMCYIGSLILGFDNAFLIAVLVGITNVVPYFGPFIGAIPSAFIVLMQGPLKMLVFVIFIVALQQFDGHILGPKLLGDSLGLTSLWIIFAVIIMTGLFGIVGMIIGVPLFSLIYMLLKYLIYDRLEKKGKSIDTADYIKEQK